MKALQELAKSIDENEDGSKKGLRGVGSVLVSDDSVFELTCLDRGRQTKYPLGFFGPSRIVTLALKLKRA